MNKYDENEFAFENHILITESVSKHFSLLIVFLKCEIRLKNIFNEIYLLFGI